MVATITTIPTGKRKSVLNITGGDVPTVSTVSLSINVLFVGSTDMEPSIAERHQEQKGWNGHRIERPGKEARSLVMKGREWERKILLSNELKSRNFRLSLNLFVICQLL